MEPIPEEHCPVFARFGHWVATVHVKHHTACSEFSADLYYLHFQKIKTVYARVLVKIATFKYWMAQEICDGRDGDVSIAAHGAMRAELAAVHTLLCERMATIERVSKKAVDWTPLDTSEVSDLIASIDAGASVVSSEAGGSTLSPGMPEEKPVALQTLSMED
jgi:hypothetical protein